MEKRDRDRPAPSRAIMFSDPTCSLFNVCLRLLASRMKISSFRLIWDRGSLTIYGAALYRW